MKRFGLLLFGVLLIVDCGGGGGGTGPTPNSIAVSAGNNQVGAAGSALPESLAVIVRDQGGVPLAGVNVTFTITAGGGSVSPASRVTDAAGIAKTRRTLGPNAGTQTVNAGAGSLAPAQFSAVSQINGAVNIANSTTGPLTDSVGATKAESLTVLVTDQTATPVSGVTVTWTSAGGTVSPTSGPTSAAGLSKVQFTYGTAAGTQSATATVAGLVGSPVVITLTATAGSAVSIAKTAGDSGTAAPGAQVTYTVQGRDTHGNAKSGVTIDWAVATGGGSITPPQNTTQANGNASATRTLGTTLGSQTATATAAGLPGAPSVTFTTNVTATVEVADNFFSPSSITVPLGTAVTWEWQGITLPHNVTFGAGGPADIPDRTSGSVSRTFNTAGTFNYVCTNHPGMNGSVTVNP
ncbi:MAG: Ig-like domain-containing protein [Gemmatimonadales bacterium]